MTARTILVVVAMAGAALSAGTDAWSSEIVACYDGGTVTRQECRSWAEHKGLTCEPEPSASLLRDIALVKTLAEAARQRGEGRLVDATIAEQRRQLLIQALRRHLADEYEIPEEQVERLFSEHPQVFDRPRKVLIRNIFKAFPAGADSKQQASVRQQMEELHRRLEQGADFAELAGQESESHTRYDGGRIGFVAAGQLAPRFDEVIAGLAEGQISPVIEHRHAEALVAVRQDQLVLPDDPSLPLLEARLLAASSDDKVRDAATSLRIARREVTDSATVLSAETMAMAQAENGRFADAAAWQRAVLQATEQRGLRPAAARARRRLALYEDHKPCRSPWDVAAFGGDDRRAG